MGVLLCALGSGALYWPEQNLLCVSDLHLGKAERQARQGQIAEEDDAFRAVGYRPHVDRFVAGAQGFQRGGGRFGRGGRTFGHGKAPRHPEGSIKALDSQEGYYKRRLLEIEEQKKNKMQKN